MNLMREPVDRFSPGLKNPRSEIPVIFANGERLP